jgi:hypothetical protein
MVNRGDIAFNVGNKSIPSLSSSSLIISIEDDVAERDGENNELAVEFRLFRIITRSILLFDRVVDSIDC